jgi:hypothetical protein
MIGSSEATLVLMSSLPKRRKTNRNPTTSAFQPRMIDIVRDRSGQGILRPSPWERLVSNEQMNFHVRCGQAYVCLRITDKKGFISRARKVPNWTTQAGMQDLNLRISPDLPVVLVGAHAINNKGQIIATAIDAISPCTDLSGACPMWECASAPKYFFVLTTVTSQ